MPPDDFISGIFTSTYYIMLNLKSQVNFLKSIARQRPSIVGFGILRVSLRNAAKVVKVILEVCSMGLSTPKKDTNVVKKLPNGNFFDSLVIF